MTKKNTKRTLLTNVIALVLCISMFVGSTFAWFTDSASTNVNTIKAGTLNVELLMKDNETWVTAEGKTLNFTDKDGETLWEPGVRHTLPTVKIKNNGSLDLKFKVLFQATTITKDLAKVLDVYVGQNNVGTLANLMVDTDGVAHGELKAGEETSEYTITLKMQESAGNEYQDAEIDGMSLIVLATQLASEYDSIDNQYDANAQYDWDGTADKEFKEELENAGATDVIEISTAAELKAFADAVNKENKTFDKNTIKLTADIDLNNLDWEPIGQTGKTQFKGVFDGQGHTIYNLNVDSTTEHGANYASGLFGWLEQGSPSVKNLTINGAKVKGHHYVAVIAGYAYGTIEDCHVLNATISNTNVNENANGDKTGAIVGYLGEDAKIKNCTATNVKIDSGRDAGQIVGMAKEANVTGCSATNVTVTANGTGTGANITNDIIGRLS